jgi:hypothetical protein
MRGGSSLHVSGYFGGEKKQLTSPASPEAPAASPAPLAQLLRLVVGEPGRRSDSCVESRDIKEGAGMCMESRPRMGVFVPSGERYESRWFGSGEAARLLRSGEETSGLGTAE